MADYKTEVTLNEKDSLTDMLTLEKTMVKIYAMAITEGASKGFRTLVENNLSETICSQFKVFTLLTEHGYYKVESAPETTLSEQKNKFSKVINQLS